jgi:hypothetical protein
VTRIASGEYEGAQGDQQHVFLVGNLAKPTDHPFVRDHRLEIIVCRYGPGDHGRYHWHPEVTEYELVTRGEVGYFEVSSGATQWFEAGDLSVVPPGVCTRRIARKGATTVAVKVPSSAKKIHCSACSRDCEHRLEPYDKASSG